MTTQHHWQVTWQTGPDAGNSWRPGSGRHVVGRAPQATIRCDDPTLQPFHVQLDLEGETPRIQQLAGRMPVRVDGADDIGPWWIHVGNSVLRLQRLARVDGQADGTQRGRGAADRTVVRMPRHIATWSPSAVHMRPQPTGPAAPTGGLAPVIAALAATLVMALALRQLMFVVFGAVGTMVAAATFVTARFSHRRRRRDHLAAISLERVRVAAELRRQHCEWATHVRTTVPTLHDTLAMIDSAQHTSGVRPNALWQRRAADGDAHRVSLGIGQVQWIPVVDGRASSESVWEGVNDGRDATGSGGDAGSGADLPVAVDLQAGMRLAISGPHAIAVANSLVLQLAILTGPADWQLVVVTTSPDSWRWTRNLPHARNALGQHLVVDEAGLLELVRDGSLAGRHTVVITDQPAMLAVRTSALRRLVSAHDSLALIVVHQGAPPAMCRSAVVTMADGRARHIADVTIDPTPSMLRLAGTTSASAERWAGSLQHLRDPEDERSNGLDIAATVDLDVLLAEAGIDVVDAASIAAAWHRAGHDPAPRTPIGRARDGVVEIDLVRDGPHALLAGTTGAGKSELLRSLVLGLSCTQSPQQLTFVLVDYKGGAAFDDLTALPHVVGTVTDLDHQLAERALRSLRAELTVRERLLRDHGVGDLAALRALPVGPGLPRILVVVDEFAALATEQADFLHALVGIAQRGRSLGVHLLLATQRPNGVISDDIRANTNLRIALRLHDTADAIDVVGDPLPASLPRSLPGRAVMRLGPDELVTFQTARATGVPAVVAAVRAAADLAQIDAPRPVWCDPLPTKIGPSDLNRFADGRGAVGVADLPDEQKQIAFHWRSSDGGVLVIGSSGSGVTSTLVTLASTVLDEPVRGGDLPRDISGLGEVFVIDGGDDAQWDAVAAHPTCAGVVRLHERERLWRLLHRVAHHGADVAVKTHLIIDGLAALRHELDAVERSTELELLDRIVGDGSVVLLVGADRVAAVPPTVASRCAVRLVLHLHDRHDGAALGVSPASMPPRIAGRAVIGSSETAVQMVAPQPVRGVGRRRRRVLGIGALPTEVRAADLPSPAHDRGSWRVPIGTGFQHLTPLVLEVGDGEHVLIAGSARTGRSTALAHMCLGWLASDTEAHVVVIAGRRSPLTRWLHSTVAARIDAHDRTEPALAAVNAAIADGRRVMLAVDDAEMVDDAGGRLAAMVGERMHGLTVVAAGRPDALRQSYGHWTLAVRRSRLGLLSSNAQDVDGDLLGATLPRRAMLAPRPGLFHLIEGGNVELVQVAMPDVADAPPIARVS